MTLVVLGATGGTGRHLVSLALGRGLKVRALVRNPATAQLPTDDRLSVVRADVHDAAGIAAAIGPDDILVSGLGPASRAEASTLTAGAHAVIAAAPHRIVWLGAAGTGPSAATTSSFTRRFLKTGLGPEHTAKELADTAILEAGGTLIHVGPLLGKQDKPHLTLVLLSRAARTFWPTSGPRVTVARLMLDAATAETPGSGVLLVRPPA
ncbi:NAD(P)H-binding protein [Actinoplanes couchii]|uniref:NADH-flavin reductase n=1 Tax=Actinoplanes couchii TaxID=403638 RepID=A0ABQ3XQR2_9ACTN|nr:NAD(P)H-binding protein [Actinoplanes couchii]MDR6318798.1 nucleoside-diphosphate-sugar epimerase [Actinoplanes couchii]GID60829.1 NADH-flavin reductase [Actinoplanes couchii]